MANAIRFQLSIMKLTKLTNLDSMIFTVRGRQVMLDYHLASIYEVETKRLNEQV